MAWPCLWVWACGVWVRVCNCVCVECMSYFCVHSLVSVCTVLFLCVQSCFLFQCAQPCFLFLCAQSCFCVHSLVSVCTVLFLCVQSCFCVHSLVSVCTVLFLCAQSCFCVHSLVSVCTILLLCVQFCFSVHSLASVYTVLLLRAQSCLCMHSLVSVCTSKSIVSMDFRTHTSSPAEAPRQIDHWSQQKLVYSWHMVQPSLTFSSEVLLPFSIVVRYTWALEHTRP